MTDKRLPKRHVPEQSADQRASIAEDITRVVGYLNEKRATANNRATGLVQEIAQRREDQRRDEMSDGLSTGTNDKLASELNEIVNALPERSRSVASPRRTNPVLAERYHSFCHDLDLILDGFRARIEGNKPVQH